MSYLQKPFALSLEPKRYRRKKQDLEAPLVSHCLPPCGKRRNHLVASSGAWKQAESEAGKRVGLVRFSASKTFIYRYSPFCYTRGKIYIINVLTFCLIDQAVEVGNHNPSPGSGTWHLTQPTSVMIPGLRSA